MSDLKACDRQLGVRCRMPVHVLIGVLAALTLAAGWRAPSHADDITVFAASSLRTALEQISDDFERETGHRLTLAFAGSPAIARQIAHGAPADIVMSANAGWMDWLEAAGWIEPDSRFDLAGNRLVLVGHGGGRETWPELTVAACFAELGDRPLAMALIASVPAGIYGQAALQSRGLWDELSPRIVQADNVRAALALVALGEAPLGLVYQSDARAEPRVSVLYRLSVASHPPIAYPVAITTGNDRDAVRQFIDFLRDDPARAVLTAQGFVVGEF
ncbi:molybdate ABC transporter substrate-binding protein [Maricaulis maris]|nr:molybdate ABC transporter substrate-binding protein [Maricaulis maris]